jgi:hypothetical protein
VTHEDDSASQPNAEDRGRARRPRGPTAYELYGRPHAAPARALPGLIFETLRVAWRAGRREVLVIVAADAVGAESAHYISDFLALLALAPAAPAPAPPVAATR